MSLAVGDPDLIQNSLDLIKTGGNRGQKKQLIRGLTIVLRYYRYKYKIRGSIPLFIKPSRIIRGLGLDDNRGTRTLIGKALAYLANNGFISRRSNGRDPTYHVQEKLLLHFRNYPCLSRCETDSSICGLLGTLDCPFLQGILEGGDYDR